MYKDLQVNNLRQVYREQRDLGRQILTLSGLSVKSKIPKTTTFFFVLLCKELQSRIYVKIKTGIVR